jgi:hypothetical protein
LTIGSQGTIKANGNKAVCSSATCGGGGSGGSIYVEITNLISQTTSLTASAKAGSAPAVASETAENGSINADGITIGNGDQLQSNGGSGITSSAVNNSTSSSNAASNSSSTSSSNIDSISDFISNITPVSGATSDTSNNIVPFNGGATSGTVNNVTPGGGGRISVVGSQLEEIVSPELYSIDVYKYIVGVTSTIAEPPVPPLPSITASTSATVTNTATVVAHLTATPTATVTASPTILSAGEFIVSGIKSGVSFALTIIIVVLVGGVIIFKIMTAKD